MRTSGGGLAGTDHLEARCCLATSTRKRYLIIGNGASGTYAAETIRKTDTEGEITLLTNEPYPLYNRVALPPFLRDQAKREKVFLRTPEQHAQKGIKLLVNTLDHFARHRGARARRRPTGRRFRTIAC